MTLKDKLEDSFIYWMATAVVATAAAVWTGCQAFYITPKAEEITQLKQKISDLSLKVKEQDAVLDPYLAEITRLRSKNQKLEVDLTQSQESLKQWQEALPGWQKANQELQAKLNLSAANCSILESMRGLQVRKDQAERWVESATHTQSSEHRNLQDYRRVASEYHARITNLQEKLSCGREG